RLLRLEPTRVGRPGPLTPGGVVESPREEGRVSEGPGKSERRRRTRYLSAHPIDIGDAAAAPPEGDAGEPATGQSEEAFLAAISGARTVDVSEDGCRLVSDTPLPRGGRLRFDLHLDDVVYSFEGRIV